MSPDDELDLFGEDTEEDIAARQLVAQRFAATNAAARGRIGPLESRSAAESRRLYMLQNILRQEVTVLRAVFSAEECAALVVAAEAAARHCGGWNTRRHSAFPTTDIPLQELDELASALIRTRVQTSVLNPTAAARGFRPEHIGCRDLFVVKYDAVSQGVQTGLAIHTDGSIISFNILLNDTTEFKGGGTFFEHLRHTVCPERGECVVHDGKYPHAGAHITSGVRYLLVGFVESTDRPWHLGSVPVGRGTAGPAEVVEAEAGARPDDDR